jgi:hypothetical protein
MSPAGYSKPVPRLANAGSASQRGALNPAAERRQGWLGTSVAPTARTIMTLLHDTRSFPPQPSAPSASGCWTSAARLTPRTRG